MFLLMFLGFLYDQVKYGILDFKENSVNLGQLIHADKHGFLVIPEADEKKLLAATEHMDRMERELVLLPGREGVGKQTKEIAEAMEKVCAKMGKEKQENYGSFRDKFPNFKTPM